MNSRRTFLRLEELGGRILPSGFSGPVQPSPVAVVQPIIDPLPPIHVLDGQLHGKATSEFTIPDVGVTWNLHGSGDLAGMGHVHVAGDVHGTGFTAQGTATGTLTLHNAGGTVVLKLTEPTGGFSLPQNFNWTVTHATGSYQSFLGDNGTLHLVLITDVTTQATTFVITVGSGSIIPPEPLIPLQIADIKGQATGLLVPAGGEIWKLQGSGTLLGMGQVTVTGSEQGVGFTSGHAQGTLTITGANGTATLALQGPEQDAFAPLLHKFHYHIVSSSGDIGLLPHHGILHLALHQTSATQATFTLTI